MIDNPLSLLATVFATAASPAITEAIKHFGIPKGLSPAINTLVAVALFSIGWAFDQAAPYAEYLLAALAVAGLSTGAISATNAIPSPRKR